MHNGAGVFPSDSALDNKLHLNNDDNNGSLGVLSSRRSANGTTENNNLHMAQSLLQYMEQRLASHNEQKQTSLSELKSKGNADGSSVGGPNLNNDD